MIGRTPRYRSYADDFDPGATFVFIPGALAGGFLVSIGMLVGDGVRRLRGDTGTNRRIALTGTALAEEVRSGAGAARRSPAGLRRRSVYGIFGAAGLGLVTGAIPGTTWNFVSPGGYLSHISWIWAVSMLVTLIVAIAGVKALHLVPEWVPITIALSGLGVIVRFALGPESATTRLIVASVAAVLTSLLIVATWRLRRSKGLVDVPASVRPFLAATPLGTAVAEDGPASYVATTV